MWYRRSIPTWLGPLSHSHFRLSMKRNILALMDNENLVRPPGVIKNEDEPAVEWSGFQISGTDFPLRTTKPCIPPGLMGWYQTRLGMIRHSLVYRLATVSNCSGQHTQIATTASHSNGMRGASQRTFTNAVRIFIILHWVKRSLRVVFFVLTRWQMHARSLKELPNAWLEFGKRCVLWNENCVFLM